MAGGSFVGMPAFIYARTPFASYGATAINPDVMDLFVEDVKEVDGREMYYDAKDKTYKDYEVFEETIKVPTESREWALVWFPMSLIWT